MASAQAKGVALLSGGIDSPVAAHLALAAGCALEALHFSGEPFFGKEAKAKARALASLLGLKGVWVVQAGRAFAAIAQQAPHPHYFVLSKRLMFRVGQRLAEETGGCFLVTGESLGQVSSQTLHNLAAIDAAASLPVARPLLGWDKQETIAYARAHGLLAVSEGPESCDVLGPRRPATRLSPEKAAASEEALAPQAMAEAVWKTRVFRKARPLPGAGQRGSR